MKKQALICTVAALMIFLAISVVSAAGTNSQTQAKLSCCQTQASCCQTQAFCCQ